MHCLIVGKFNPHKFTFDSIIDSQLNKPLSLYRQEEDIIENVTYCCNCFIELLLPNQIIINIGQIGKPKKQFIINPQLPWLELNFNNFKITREHIKSIYYDIILEEENLEYTINTNPFLYKSDILSEGEISVFKHRIFDYEYVKVYFEFDDNPIYNTIEYKGIEPSKLSFLVTVIKIEETINIKNDPVELPELKRSFYVKFKNERDELININHFLINF